MISSNFDGAASPGLQRLSAEASKPWVPTRHMPQSADTWRLGCPRC